MNNMSELAILVGGLLWVFVYLCEMLPRLKRQLNNNALAIIAEHRQLYAEEKASLVEGWTWRPGYQSHFVAHDGTLIPTCNVSPWASTPEDMMDAYWNQVAIIKRYEDLK